MLIPSAVRLCLINVSVLMSFGFVLSYQMIGKLGGHAGHVMTLLLLGKEEPYLMLTGSRDHYIKVGGCGYSGDCGG